MAGQRPKGWKLLKAALATRKSATMLAFGFSSGLPFALLIGTLNAWLGDAKINLATIGVLSWIGLTYAFKFLWSPLVDRVHLPLLAQLGRRKSWILLCQAGLIVSFIGLGLRQSRGEHRHRSRFSRSSAPSLRQPRTSRSTPGGSTSRTSARRSSSSPPSINSAIAPLHRRRRHRVGARRTDGLGHGLSDHGRACRRSDGRGDHGPRHRAPAVGNHRAGPRASGRSQHDRPASRPRNRRRLLAVGDRQPRLLHGLDADRRAGTEAAVGRGLHHAGGHGSSSRRSSFRWSSRLP